MITISISGNRADIQRRESICAGQDMSVKFCLDKWWTQAHKTAVFRAELGRGRCSDAEVLQDNWREDAIVDIPKKLLRQAGAVIYAGMYGMDEDCRTMTTCWTRLGNVQPSAIPVFFTEEIPPLGEQILQKVNDIEGDIFNSTKAYVDSALAKKQNAVTEQNKLPYGLLTDTPVIPTVPAALPNPKALSFTGAVTGSYDGSSELVINIPAGGGSGAVSSVNGQTGEVSLTAADVGALPASAVIPGNADEISYTKSANHPAGSVGEAFAEIKEDLSQLEKSKADRSHLCSPNLLDNWYFGNPVNQREKTSYSGADYGFDRWRTNFSGDTVEKTDNGIKNTVASTSSGLHLHQRLEIDGNLASRKIQASALITGLLGSGIRLIVSFRNSSRDEIKASSAELKNGLVSFTETIPQNCAYIYFGLYAYTGVRASDFVELSAAKLELGSSQTLAHQENGAWVLNEIPDYGEQLRRCQRYFYRIGRAISQFGFAQTYSANGMNYYIALPVPMRIDTPSLQYSVAPSVKMTDATVINCDTMTVTNGASYGRLYGNVTKNGEFTLGQLGQLRINGTGNSIDVYADL